MKRWLVALAMVAGAHAQNVEGTNVIADVVERATPSVVDIQASVHVHAPVNALFFGMRARTGRSVGAGVIFDPRGYVLTNEHVVHGASTALVTLSDGRKVQATVRGADPATDIAVLELPGMKPGAREVARLSTGRVRVGDWVVAVGSPFHLQTSVSKGIISGLGRDLVIQGRAYKGLLQTDAVMNPGNSGGPLFNMKGEVVGIATATTRGNAIGFAIPIASAAETARRLLAAPAPRPRVARVVPHVHTRVAPRRTSDLGLTVRALTRREAQALPAAFQRGVMVSTVAPGTLGQSIGLAPGDVIGWLNGAAVDSPATFDRQKKQSATTGQLALRAWRNGTFLMLQLSL